MTLRGEVKNGVVILQNAGLPDGTVVEVTPVHTGGSNGTVPAPISNEQREALLSLIGIWKTSQPPNDDDVQRIVKEARMKKYG